MTIINPINYHYHIRQIMKISQKNPRHDLPMALPMISPRFPWPWLGSSVRLAAHSSTRASDDALHGGAFLPEGFCGKPAIEGIPYGISMVSS